MTDSSATPAPVPFTLADFVAAEVPKILGAHADADCHALNKVFWKAKEGAQSAAASRALELLAGICSMRLVPEESCHIYRPMVEFSDGGSSMALGHIPKDAVEALAQLAGTLDSVSLRARVADLVWMLDRSRGRLFPLMAVQAYRRLPLSSDAWYGESKTGWHRALQLAKQIHAEDEARAIETALLDAFFAAAGDEDGYQALHYLHPLRVERRSGGRAQAVAERLEAIGGSGWPSRTHSWPNPISRLLPNGTNGLATAIGRHSCCPWQPKRSRCRPDRPTAPSWSTIGSVRR